MFNVNVLGLLLTTQAAVKHLGEGGSIINIGSVVSQPDAADSSVYTGTKGAVDAITGVLAASSARRRSASTRINPGMVETEGTHTAGFIGSDFETGAVAQTPLGRIGQPDDIAASRGLPRLRRLRWLTGEQISRRAAACADPPGPASRCVCCLFAGGLKLYNC